MSWRSTKAFSSGLTAIAFACGLSLMASQARAQQHTADAAIRPFKFLAGIWSGTGLITMQDGARDRIRCRGTYAVHGGGDNVLLELRCASDSYKFELSSDITQSGGHLRGNWSENTRHIGGTVSGRATSSSIQARAESDIFTALLAVNTHGDRQTVSIQSPGSEMSEVSISLTRGSR